MDVPDFWGVRPAGWDRSPRRRGPLHAAQPGVPALRLQSNQAQIRVVHTESRPGSPVVQEQVVSPVPEAAAAAAPAPAISGPQDAVAGSAIQITINNPTAQPLSTDLTFDPEVFQPAATGLQPGRATVQIPAGGVHVMTFNVKATVQEGSSTFSLTSGGALSLRVHPANKP